MTSIKVTPADRERADLFFPAKTISHRQDLAELFARHRIEAQRPLLEALEKAQPILQCCPDKQKKAEVLIEAAIKQAKGE